MAYFTRLILGLLAGAALLPAGGGGLTCAQQTSFHARQAGPGEGVRPLSVSSGRTAQVRAHFPPEGRRAAAFAAAQLGKPYRWGAAGPDAFDCSGLTSQAWRAAGKEIPRTSQIQWNSLRHVSLGELQAGDLVIYYKNASHVAIYMGGGQVIHAPRPGRSVRFAGLRAMPALGAVRPGPASAGPETPALLTERPAYQDPKRVALPERPVPRSAGTSREDCTSPGTEVCRRGPAGSLRGHRTSLSDPFAIPDTPALPGRVRPRGAGDYITRSGTTTCSTGSATRPLVVTGRGGVYG
ncbi:C40 family peptidase [Streptomyces klenkii]|uniref:C40 family peptidase n=1 Tax=Streptomyces klenkii TaxID=1420899 RepID=UPI003F4B6327